MKISHKLGWGTGLLTLVIAGLSTMAWFLAEDIRFDVERLYLTGISIEKSNARMHAAVDQLGLATDALIEATRHGGQAPGLWPPLEQALASLSEARFATIRATTRRQALPESRRGGLEQTLGRQEAAQLQHIAGHIAALSRSITGIRSPDLSAADRLARLRHIAGITRQELDRAVSRHQDLIHERLAGEIARTRDATVGLLKILFIVSFVTLAGCGIAALALRQQIVTPLRRLERQARAVAAGDRQVRLSRRHRSTDELGVLAGAFDEMVEALNATTVSRAELESLVHQSTRELAKREEQFRDLFDNTTDLIQSVDPDGRFLYVNRTWREALGYTGADLPALRIFDIIAPAHHAQCQAIMRRLLAGETVAPFELSFVTKDGRLLPVEGHVNARMEGTRPVFTRGIFRDISARKQNQEIIRQQMEFLESLGQTALDLLSRPQLSVLLPAVVERAARLLDSPYVEIALLEGEELVVRSSYGLQIGATGDRANRRQAVFSWQAIDRREPVIIENFASHPEGRELYRRWGFHAVAIFPILRGEECLGLIALLRLRPGHVFSPQDIQKGRLLAQLTALVLHNTSIYEQALRAAETKTAALLASEKVYRHLVENINQGFYTADYHGKFLYYNPAICIVSGRTAAELDGTSSFRLVAPEDRLRVIRQYREWAHGTETDVRIEFRIATRKPGRLVWMEQVSHIVRDATGQPVEFRNSLRDITERKAAELALRESEERNRLLFDSSPIPIILSLVPEGVIVDVNQAALDHFNYTRDQAVGHTVAELASWLRPGDREHIIHQLQTVGHINDFEAPRQVQDGRIMHLLHNSRVVMLNGRPHALSTIRDITERKAAELARHESEERFRMLFDSSPVPVVLSSVPEGVIVDANQAALDHFNYTRDQAVGRTALDLALWVNPADREHFIHQLQTTGRVEDFEAVMQVRDGRTLNILHHSRIITLNGQPHAINTIRDITAQRQAETEISRLALLAQETDNGVLLTDNHGRIVWANAGFTRMNGYTFEEVKGRKPGEFLRGPKSDPSVSRHIRERLALHEQFAVDVRNYHKSGHTYWARLAVQPWRDHLGKVQGYFSMATDITDRVLETQMMRLLSAGQTSPDGADVLHHIARHLPDLLEVDVCLIGLPDHSVHDHYRSHGFSLQDRLLPDFIAPITGCVAEFLLRNDTTPARPLPRMPDLVDFIGAPLPGSGSVPIGFIAVLSRRPIEHRARLEPVLQRLGRKLAAELARRQAEDKFRDLFAFSPDAIVITGTDGHINDVNQRALTLFGYSREELLGRTVAMLMPSDHLPELMERLNNYLAHPVPHAMGSLKPGLCACDKSGRVFPIDISLSPLNTAQGAFIVSAIRDITKQIEAEADRRKAEVQLRQNQKIESLGTLAGGIAHDFNNILTGMLGAAEIARLEIPAGHPATTWLDHINTAGLRAKNLVQQILTFSRKNDGQLIPQPLQPVITEAVALLRSTIPSMIRIETSIDAACPPVLADGTQIHQVLMNLCTNAWHAAPEENGLIEIALFPVRLTPESAKAHAGLPPGDYACLTVRDNGGGMNPAVQEHLFEPFFTTKPKGRGTGLGLAVVHGIIQGHKGAIFVHSRLNEGTLFRIFLPALFATDAATATPAAAPVIPGRQERILLVDDDPLSLTSLAGQLQHIGYRVTAVAAPAAALEGLAARPDDFDLILSDFAMPGMSGLQLVTKALAIRPRLPVILISGYVEPRQAKDLHAAGIREILRKPVSLSELSKVIARHLLPSHRK